jgi:hypothetical protein
MDETYIKVHKQWVYLYCAVEKGGQTVDFFLSPNRKSVREADPQQPWDDVKSMQQIIYDSESLSLRRCSGPEAYEYTDRQTLKCFKSSCPVLLASELRQFLEL